MAVYDQVREWRPSARGGDAAVGGGGLAPVFYYTDCFCSLLFQRDKRSVFVGNLPYSKFA